MLIAADTHVHLYPCYDLYEALRWGLRNLDGLAQRRPALKVLFLTERHDCAFFKSLAAGACLHPGFTVEPAGEEALWVDFADRHERLLLVAGRQIVTRERLEVLALAAAGRIGDGRPVSQVLEEIHALRGVPVLNWSPGKWFFGRGAVVRGLIKNSPAHRFLVGDVAMRPRLWPAPRLISRAVRLGYKLAAGSDPLPFKGEERGIGRYGMVGEAEIGAADPVADLRRWLRVGAWRVAGTRDSVSGMLRRQAQNERARRAA